ncbi:hypothetical protein GLW08_08130 [Pontibacillus yanchengensis]|uniref:Uncharacterized protein n=1 Tax=Pontibacillus yanchengensis TaxID=462910 RepID=A0ACC7VGS1_9BACI|nr:hypothetical protein [Pontibacillus yanchengensis]MYL53305.1 hypothetical protein [Pontibacillus yanchengensis]
MQTKTTQAIRALFRFWQQNLGEGNPAVRVKQASDFIAEWENHVDLAKKITKHPATRKKMRERNYSILDVLADYIISADQVAERRAEYTVYNPDKEYNALVKPKKDGTELSLLMDGELEADEDDSGIFQAPPYCVLEYDVKPDLPPQKIRKNS